jgi:hypothetical protein
MPTSKAQIRAVDKWRKENRETVTILLPLGTKDRIKATGETINGFIASATLAALDDAEHKPEGD